MITDKSELFHLLLYVRICCIDKTMGHVHLYCCVDKTTGHVHDC